MASVISNDNTSLSPLCTDFSLYLQTGCGGIAVAVNIQVRSFASPGDAGFEPFAGPLKERSGSLVLVVVVDKAVPAAWG